MVDFEELRALVALSDSGSFLVAARVLDTSRARLRRKLAALEERTGVPLLVRSGGALVVTPAGDELVRGARRLLDEGSTLVSRAREIGTEPTGVLRGALQVGFPFHTAQFGAALFRRHYPGVRVEMIVTEEPIKMLPERADFAVCAGDPVQAPGCVEIPMVSMRQQLLASPGYLGEYGTPQSVEEVLDRPLYAWMPPGGRCEHLATFDGGRIPIEPVLSSSDDRFLRHLAEPDRALIYVPNAEIPEVEFTELTVVLGDQVGRPLGVRLYVPHVLQNVPRVRAVVDAARKLGVQ